MNFNYDHEKFVNKNRAIAGGYVIEKTDDALEKKGFSRYERQQDASCFNCKLKPKCAEFRSKRSGGALGAVSFGGSERFMCDRYVPAPSQEKNMSDRQIKSLLKNTKKGRM
jgi:hypothetical protein